MGQYPTVLYATSRPGGKVQFSVLAILPPGKFPAERSTPVYSPKECSPPTLFRLVVRFTRVRIGDSSRSRFAWTVYFAQSQTMLFPWTLFMGAMFRSPNFQCNFPCNISFPISKPTIYDTILCILHHNKHKLHHIEINWRRKLQWKLHFSAPSGFFFLVFYLLNKILKIKILTFLFRFFFCTYSRSSSKYPLKCVYSNGQKLYKKRLYYKKC